MESRALHGSILSILSLLAVTVEWAKVNSCNSPTQNEAHLAAASLPEVPCPDPKCYSTN